MNPFAANPLRTRADLQQAALDLVTPLFPHFSPGNARVRIGHTGTYYSEAGAELEGFARPLWAVASLVAGGGEFPALDRYRQGLAHGTNPTHPEYWGDPGDCDQRLVEMAPLGFALAVAAEKLFDPLPDADKANVIRWLSFANQRTFVDNNWWYFRVMANLGLRRIGANPDPAALQFAFERLESFYVSDGWYKDGNCPRLDYYIPSDFHFLGLIYAHLAGRGDEKRGEQLKHRASRCAQDVAHWFAHDGAAVPFGRSLTYRFDMGSIWAALAFANVEALPWGVIKGLLLRHLRWWSQQPCFSETGLLTIGFCYPNLNMAEAYNSPQSPYWGAKCFLPLALPESHPFWTSEERLLPDLPAVRPQKNPGFVVCADQRREHVVILSSGQVGGDGFRHAAEKYEKFAYSSKFAFSVPAAQRGLELGAHDSMLALSEDQRYWRVRSDTQSAGMDGNVLWSRWSPWSDVEITTWLWPVWPWHVRLHRIRTGRKLFTAEGGFAQTRTGEGAVIDLLGRRRNEIVPAAPNTNLIRPVTEIPTLRGEHPVGEHWLGCAVSANANPPQPTPPVLHLGFDSATIHGPDGTTVRFTLSR